MYGKRGGGEEERGERRPYRSLKGARRSGRTEEAGKGWRWGGGEEGGGEKDRTREAPQMS